MKRARQQHNRKSAAKSVSSKPIQQHLTKPIPGWDKASSKS